LRVFREYTGIGWSDFEIIAEYLPNIRRYCGKIQNSAKINLKPPNLPDPQETHPRKTLPRRPSTLHQNSLNPRENNTISPRHRPFFQHPLNTTAGQGPS
jgi:hypothetical protein